MIQTLLLRYDATKNHSRIFCQIIPETDCTNMASIFYVTQLRWSFRMISLSCVQKKVEKRKVKMKFIELFGV